MVRAIAQAAAVWAAAFRGPIQAGVEDIRTGRASWPVKVPVSEPLSLPADTQVRRSDRREDVRSFTYAGRA
ncbi:hypothetical protein [Sinimarinibacterium thermocellulolyticum]|jgi:hypothetical protein|uniref:Uncharacterized protein n=1 Tax=Sinimarinibacterium thermocellulolyticum TaxID=3170016 RepID=A0ABV2A9V3_9GAMM